MSKTSRQPCELEKAIMEAVARTGWTQQELAARSGVPQSVVCRFLSGDPAKRRTILLPAADRLCAVLGLRLVKARGKGKG
jgi:ribosome-binding protein aMBF1 (putative translation factor)